MPEGREFVARVYAAINARDRAAIRAMCAPDIVVGTTVEAYRGPEAVLEWLDEGDDAFDDFAVELLEVEDSGDTSWRRCASVAAGRRAAPRSTTGSPTSGRFAPAGQ